MRSAWSVAVTLAGIDCLLLLASYGCGEESPHGALDAEGRDSARLTDLSSTLSAHSVSDPARAPAPESSELGGSSQQPSAPRSDEDDPACQDTCSSKRFECGKVCGQSCGSCRNGEECKNGKCECKAACDGTRCANACGQACACAAGTACDATGFCVPESSCRGAACAPAQVPELPLPPPDPVPVEP